jgi:hypothetical protein
MEQKNAKKNQKSQKNEHLDLLVAKEKGNKKKLHVEAKEQGTKDLQNNYTHVPLHALKLYIFFIFRH